MNKFCLGVSDDQTTHIAVGPVDPEVLLHGGEDVQPVLGAGVRRDKIVLNQVIGRGVCTAGQGQGR
ncbi:hypothetical protein D3C74_306750 [compost metagenome]